VAEDLSERIEQDAANPESASADGVSVKRRSLRDLIDADKHLSNRRASSSPTAALRRVKIVPPGAV